MASDTARQQTTVSIEGPLSLDRAATFRLEILEALEAGRDVAIDFSGVSDLDLSCLQILYAARLSADDRGLAFRLDGSIGGKTGQRLLAAGFVPRIPTNGAELEELLVGYGRATS